MRALLGALGLVVVLGARTPVCAQVAPGDAPPRAQVVAVARDIMQAAPYCTLVTIGPNGQPQARIVDPFLKSDVEIISSTLSVFQSLFW